MQWHDVDGVPREEAERRTLSGLLWFANARGYKPGWASVKFKALFGKWPDREKGVDAEAPVGGLMNWVTREQLAYAAECRRLGIVRRPKVARDLFNHDEVRL